MRSLLYKLTSTHSKWNMLHFITLQSFLNAMLLYSRRISFNFSLQCKSSDGYRLDRSCLAECCKQLGHFMQTHTPLLKGSQGRDIRTEHNAVYPPWRVQMEYIVHSWKCLRAAVRVVDNTCYFMLPHTGRKAEIASESCVPRAMKNSLCGPGISAATGRQLLAWLPTPFLFHYFTFHLE